MAHDTCMVPGCDKSVKRAGYCYAHYMKNWRYGTPTPDHGPGWDDIRGQRFGALVVVERQGSRWFCRCDCGQTRLARAGDLNRFGDRNTCGDRKIHRRTADAGYEAAHQRVKQDRGPIHEHHCVDCGGPARHWSYDHTDPDERYAEGLSLNPIAYSLDPVHYSPRCVSCHKLADLDHVQSSDPLGRRRRMTSVTERTW